MLQEHQLFDIVQNDKIMDRLRDFSKWDEVDNLQLFLAILQGKWGNTITVISEIMHIFD